MDRRDAHDAPPAGTTPGMTRRRVLALGAAGGVGGLLLGPGGAAAARAARAGGLQTAWRALPADALPGGGRAGAVITTSASFDLLGVTGARLDGAGAEVRVRRAGRWSPWVPLGAGTSHAPDAPRTTPASDPVWAGGADALQLRARRAVRGGRLHLVSVPAATVPAAGRGLRATTRADGAPAIIPRADWGAGAVPPRAAPSYGAVNLAFVHHTVNANTYAPADSARIVLAIAKYHRDTNGWNDIGYNFLVDRFGQVFEGRAGGIDRAVIGAQAGGWNSQSTGVAIIGDFASVPVPEAALAAATRLIAWKLALHGVPLSGPVTLRSGGGQENRYPYGTMVTLQRVSGHRDGCRTDCPGATLYGQLDTLRARVAASGPPTTAAAAPVVTFAAALPEVAYGDDAVVGGLVSAADGSALAGAAVSVQKLTPGGTWVRVASATTGADGRYSAKAAWKRAAPLRAVVKVGGARASSPSVTVGLLRAITVTTPAERSRILAGGKLAMRGTCGPPAPVQILVDRQTPKGRWASAGTVGAAVDGTAWSVSVPLPRPGLYRLTAVTGPNDPRVGAAPVFVRAVKDPAKLALP